MFLILFLSFSVHTVAQDGSDIRYKDIQQIDSTYAGKFVHLDFYNRSFGAFNVKNKDLNDTINIQLNNKKINFKEHRVDNGYNNWFSQQYMESVDVIDGYKIRIVKSKIKEVKKEIITVILFLEYRDENGEINDKKSDTIEHKFPKKIITEVLVKI